jgi:serine phosphatase RsbU (regulator of sigma subunit)
VLEPGDRLVFVTDGMLERNVASIDLPGAIAASRTLHPREAVRWLADSALDAAGHALADDATVLCLDWHGGHERERHQGTGADPLKASAPL